MRRQQASMLVLQGLACVQRTSSARRHQSQMENSMPSEPRHPPWSSYCIWRCDLQPSHPPRFRVSNFRIHYLENLFKSADSGVPIVAQWI